MTVNFALLGTGRIAENQLAPAIAEVDGAELWSVFSRDEDRALSLARRHGARAPSPAFTDLASLLADPALHAVIIATPDKIHADQAVAAARAGKHVFTEKPMATSVADADRMLEAADNTGVKLGVAYHMRWHAGHRRLARAVQEGLIGEIRHARIQWSFLAADADNWRASAEVGRWWSLAGVGTHCIDQLRWILRPRCGEVVEQKNLISRPVFGGPHDETAVLSFRFESGATAELCSSVLFNAPKRFELYGSEGYAVCEDTLGPEGKGRIWTHDGVFAFEPENPYAGEIRDFAEAVVADREPEVPGEEGLENIKHMLSAMS
jgi:1,5-anhydro-D-fructose reductase (1,5-anhydro-D-mannitol-forming)